MRPIAPDPGGCAVTAVPDLPADGEAGHGDSRHLYADGDGALVCDYYLTACVCLREVVATRISIHRALYRTTCVSGVSTTRVKDTLFSKAMMLQNTQEACVINYPPSPSSLLPFQHSPN